MSSFTPEFELATVASYWRDPLLTASFAGKLKGGFFQDPKLAAVVGLVDVYWNRYAELPSESTLIELIRKSAPDDSDAHQRQRDSLTAQVKALSAVDITNTQWRLEQISNWLKWSATYDAVTTTIDELQAGKDIGDDLVQRFEAATQYGAIKLDPGLFVSKDAEKALRAEVNPDKRLIVPTGIEHLDQMINGGGRAGELVSFLAPPKGFKSGTLLNIGWNARKMGIDKVVVYLTLELSQELQMLRFAQRTTLTEKERLYENPNDYIKLYHRNLKTLHGPDGEFIIKFFPPHQCTPNTIRRYLDGLKRQGIEVGLLCVDYLDLLGSDHKKEKDYLEKLMICTDLRQVAIDYHIPIWTAARATREAIGKKRINMSHMSGSIERVAVCDMILALCQTDEERVNGMIRICPVAARNDAGNKIIHCQFEPAKMMIQSVEARDMDDEDFEEEDEGSSGARKKMTERREKGRLEARKAAEDI